jgi:protein-S-isoprenylcysteine O-methyltransferase Ste14
MLAVSSKSNLRSGFGACPGFRVFILVLILLLFRLGYIKFGEWSTFYTHHQFNISLFILVIMGVALVILGLLWAVWARMYLGKNWGMPMSVKQDPELVTTGPYRYSRHPIYSGILLAMLGTSFAVGLYFLSIFIIFGIYFTFSGLKEEEYLLNQFGKRYERYKQTSKMLIPFIF